MEDGEIAMVDQLCGLLYQGNNQQRKEAELKLATLSELQHLSRWQQLAIRSTSLYTKQLSCVTIRKILINNCTNMTVNNILEITKFALDNLVQRGSDMDGGLANSFGLLLAQSIKLAWCMDSSSQLIPSQVVSLLMINGKPSALCLMVCDHMVTEFSQQETKRNMDEHKKALISFRDGVLFNIFQMAVDTLNQSQQDHSLREKALKLVLSCLTYDFRCIIPDDSVDVTETIYPPASWFPILQNSSTILTLWAVYNSSLGSSCAQLSLQIIVLFCSLSKSFFSSPETRSEWLSLWLTTTGQVMSSGLGLNDTECFIEFTKVLGRIKANVSMIELVSCPKYPPWVTELAKFTCKCFTSEGYGLFYILQLWSSIACSMSLVSNANVALEGIVSNLVLEFLNSRHYISKCVVENAGDNPLLDPQENCIDALQPLCKILTPFYSQILPSLTQNIMECSNDLLQKSGKELFICETRSGWLLYIAASIVGGHAGLSDIQIISYDAELSCHCLKLSHALKNRSESKPASEYLIGTELASLHFWREYKRVYLSDEEEAMEIMKTQMTARLNTNSDDVLVQTLSISLAFNLQYWHQSDSVINATLQLLNDFTTRIDVAGQLIKVPFLEQMVVDRENCNITLLTNKRMQKPRRLFMKCITRIFLSARIDNLQLTIEQFLKPQDTLCTQIGHKITTPGSKPDEIFSAVSDLASDLSAVIEVCNTSLHIKLFVDWFAPKLDFFDKCLEFCSLDYGANTRLLKLMAIIYSKNHILNSPLLLNHSTQVVTRSYKLHTSGGVHILPTLSDPWKQWFKPIYLCLLLSHKALVTHNAPDHLLQAISMVLHSLTQFPVETLLSWPKLSRTYFMLLGDIFQYHFPIIQSSQTVALVHICQALLFSVEQSHINRRSTNRALTAINYLFLNHQQLGPRLQSSPDILTKLASSVFSLTLMDSKWNQQSLLVLSILYKQELLRTLEEVNLRLNATQQLAFQSAGLQFLSNLPNTCDSTAKEHFSHHLSALNAAYRP